MPGLKKGPQNADYHCVADEPATESARLHIILNSNWSILEPSWKQPLQISSPDVRQSSPILTGA